LRKIFISKKNCHIALFAEIKQRHDLKHATITHDASLPFIAKDIHIKESPQKRVLAVGKDKFNSALSTAKQVAHTIGEKTQQVAHTLEKVGYKLSPSDQKEDQNKFVDPLASPKELLLVKSQLKHAQTQDKSKPVIEKGVRINQNHHKALFAEIKQRHDLKHVETTHDTSLPFIENDVHIEENHRKDLFAEIKQQHDLKHVKTHDASSPFIEKDVHIKESPQKKVLDAGKETLNTALSTAKQVAHTIGEKTQQVAHALEEKVGYKLSSSDYIQKEEFIKFVDPLASPRDLEEVKSHLKPAQTQDKSKPVIENDVHIKENHHKDLFVEIEQQHDLNHVKTTHDASEPFIAKDIHIKEAPQKQVLSDIITQHHVSNHDVAL